MKLKIEIGDATRPDIDPPYWIMHGCNNLGAWGAGFVVALNNVYGIQDGSPFKEYLKWFDDALQDTNVTPQLGDIQFVNIGKGNRVVNMITQKGCGPVYCKKTEIGIPFRYESFEECLNRVKVYALAFEEKNSKFPTLVSPWIGCGLAMAEKEEVKNVIHNVFDDIDIEYIIYDLPLKSKNNLLFNNVIQDKWENIK